MRAGAGAGVAGHRTIRFRTLGVRRGDSPPVWARTVYAWRSVLERIRLGGYGRRHGRRHGGPSTLLALLVTAGICVAAPSTSLAATFSGPLLTGPPTITGSPVVGQTLTASVQLAPTAP